MRQNDPAIALVDEDARMKSQMEKAAPTYDAYMRKATFGRERALREMTVDLAQVKPGDSILEVGCGTGTLTLAAKRRAGPSGKAFGIDVIPMMIDLSRAKAAQAHEDISFQLASIEQIPFPADQFDVVMCSFMIFHMSEMVRRKGISEIYRVLKPQGRLLVLDSAMPTQPLLRAILQKLLGELPQGLPALRPLLEASGFADIESGPAPFRVLGLSLLGFVRARARKS